MALTVFPKQVDPLVVAGSVAPATPRCRGVLFFLLVDEFRPGRSLFAFGSWRLGQFPSVASLVWIPGRGKRSWWFVSGAFESGSCCGENGRRLGC